MSPSSAHEVILCGVSTRGKPLLLGALSVVFQSCHTVAVGVVCTQWYSLPTMWFCVMFHIGEKPY